MKSIQSFGCSTVLAGLLCGTTAFADVTASEVWEQWKGFQQGLGHTIDAGSEAMEGDTLVVKNITTGFDDGTRQTEGEIDEIRLQQLGDGTVRVTMSEEARLAIINRPAIGAKLEIAAVARQTGLELLISGTPEDMAINATLPELRLNVDELSAQGTKAPFAMQITLKENTGLFHRAAGSGLQIDGDITSKSVSFSATGADPDNGGTVTLNGSTTGLAGKIAMEAPSAGKIVDMSQELRNGLRFGGNLTYQNGKTHIETDGGDGVYTADSSSEAGALHFDMSADGIRYGGQGSNSKLALAGQSMPLPIELAIGETVFDLALPVMKSEEASPANLLIKLVDVSVSDTLWAMFDPETKLPHDPATLIIDLSGAVRPLVDLFAEDASATKEPFEVAEAKLNQLQLKLMGAELAGTGTASVDYSKAEPKPQGLVELTLSGANQLMTTLTEMGLLQAEQAMGARMMLGMFAVPAGEDRMTTKLEFREDGGIYANGQRIQ
ncbi:MAG: DUF2125 domain-containing protein [Paracoccaceae bacterium]